jgi:hypothetical protein
MLRELTLADALIVCGDMRPEDAACVRSATGREPGEWFAVDRWQTYGPAWTLLQDGQPWAIGGLALRNAWSGVLWLICRPGMRSQSWRKALRQTRTVIANAMAPGNPERRRRIEAHVLHGWGGATGFAQRLGLTLEGVMQQAGAQGESIEVWAATGPTKGAACRVDT